MEEEVRCPHTPVAPPPTRNPFSASGGRVWQDREHFPTFSPSVFRTDHATVSSCGKFQWTIDEISRLHPADIDEIPEDQAKVHSHKKWEKEQEIQKDIDKFFSQKLVVPSPWVAKQQTKQVTFSPLPPTYIEVLVPSSPQQDTDTSTIETESYDGLCCEEVNDSQSALIQEVEKLQDLSFTALRRKLFEAPLEMQEEQEAMAVIAMSSEDEFDGLLVTNSGMESPICLKQQPTPSSRILPDKFRCSPGQSPKEASPLPSWSHGHRHFGGMLDDLSPILSQGKSRRRLAVDAPDVMNMSVTSDSGILSVPVSPMKDHHTMEQDSSGCYVYYRSPSSHDRHDMRSFSHSNCLAMSPDDLSVTGGDRMSLEESSRRRPLGTVSGNTPNRLRYQGKKDLPVRRLSSSLPDRMPQKSGSDKRESLERECVGIENQLVSSGLLAKKEQLKSQLLFDTGYSFQQPQLSDFRMSPRRQWSPGHSNQSQYSMRSMRKTGDNALASSSINGRSSSPGKKFVRWREEMLQWEKSVTDTKVILSGMKS